MKRVGYIGSSNNDELSRQILELGTCDVARWHPEQDSDAKSRKALAAFADIPLIVITGGIEGIRKVARRLGDVITGRHVVVHTIRGIEPSSLLTVSDILLEETPTRRIGFVTGPVRTKNFEAGQPGSVVCASHFPEVHDLVEEAMMSPKLRVYRSRDLLGAELASTYTRIIAFLTGIGAAMDVGPALEATLFTRGLAEAGRFVVHYAGDERTCFGLAGAGNLYVDIHGDGSTDFAMGRHLVETASADVDDLAAAFGAGAQELIDLVVAVEELADKTSLELHLLEAITALINRGMSTERVVQELMALPALYE